MHLTLIILVFSVTVVTCCTNNTDCNNVGTCRNGKCQCLFGYSGPSCSFHFSKDKHWLTGYYTMGAITSFLNLLVFVWSVYLLKRKLKFNEKSFRLAKPWNVLHSILLLISLASAIRVVWGVLDPRSIRGISPRGSDVFLYYTPIVLLFEVDFCLAVLWYQFGSFARVSLQGTSGVRKIVHPEKSKIAMTIFFVSSVVTLYPAGFPANFVGCLFYSCVSDYCKGFKNFEHFDKCCTRSVPSVCGVTYGIKFRTILLEILESNKSKIVRKMFDATQLLIFVNIFIFVIIIVLIIDTAIGNWAYPFVSIAYQMFYRLGELVFEASILWMTKRINPTSSPESSVQSTEISIGSVSNFQTLVSVSVYNNK